MHSSITADRKAHNGTDRKVAQDTKTLPVGMHTCTQYSYHQST